MSHGDDVEGQDATGDVMREGHANPMDRVEEMSEEVEDLRGRENSTFC